MNQQYGKQVLDQARSLLEDAHIPDQVQAFAKQGVAASQEFCTKTAAVTQDNAKALTEIADTAWGHSKMLNDRILQNLTANVEAAFTAAHELATASSLSKVAKIQAEFIQNFAARATEQTKEFVDLSTRASQHIFEKAQAAAVKSIKPPT
jgi:hypothetical protein